jgi:hypothetical protein
MSTDNSKSPRQDTPLEDSEVIAVREYFVEGTSPPDLVVVRLGKPRLRDFDGKYECGTEISEGGRVWVRRMVGDDAFEALQLALRLVGTDLNHINDQLFSQASCPLWSNGDRRDLVLPVYSPWPKRTKPGKTKKSS